MAEFWPVRLHSQIAAGTVLLRPLERSDEPAWQRIRAENHAWLQPWEASSPVTNPGSRPANFRQYVNELNREAKAGLLLPFVVELNGQMVGQLTVSSIQLGSLWSGSVGYWLSQRVAGKGIMPTAVAMACDYCFFVLGLHRIEINIRPENHRSLRVVEKLGFRDEGIRKGYLHIQGKWSDHRTFALIAEDVPMGVLNRFLANTP